MGLQYGRALALLRAPIWQSFWREAARPGIALPSLALLLGSLPRKELSERAWETPLVPSLPQLRSCLPLGTVHKPDLAELAGFVKVSLLSTVFSVTGAVKRAA